MVELVNWARKAGLGVIWKVMECASFCCEARILQGDREGDKTSQFISRGEDRISSSHGMGEEKEEALGRGRGQGPRLGDQCRIR